MSILDKIRQRLSIDGHSDAYTVPAYGMTVGVVVGTDDPLQMGRLQIYCPTLNDDPKKVQHLPWAVYVSPFGGSIRNSSHTKGHDPDNSTSSGTTQYGFWAIPEMGANVLVTCINGNPRERVWMGCMFEHQETAGVLNGVYDWEGPDGEPDGPFCSPGPGYEDEREKLQPLYENQKKAFNDDKKSPEWKTRAADYSGSTNVDIESFGTNSSISGAESDPWVKEKVGAMGYDWTSFKSLGAYMASKIVGFMSPGLHSISMDDRAFNSRIRIRTTDGSQILLDDTNERIYVSTCEGKSWVEMDRNGNIDLYGDRRISIHSKKDLNLSSDETVRIKGNKGVHVYSGDNEGQEKLGYTPKDGEIRFHAVHDIHMLTERTYRHYSEKDSKFEVKGATHLTTHEMFVHATPTDDYTGIKDGGGIYIMGDNEIHIKTPINTISLTPTIGLQLATNLNVVINAGEEIVQVSNLGIVVDNLCDTGVPLESSNPMILSTMGGTQLYGLGAGDFGCAVPTNSGLFKIDLDGNITLQTVTDTLITRGTDALGNKFSTSIKSINDTHDEFRDRYNETVASIRENLVLTDVFNKLVVAASITNIGSAAWLAVNAYESTLKVPSLKYITQSIITDVIGMFRTPNLMLPDLCVPPVQVQITFAYDVAGFIEDDLGLGPLSLASTEGLVVGSGLKFGIGDESGTCHSTLSDVKFAVWPNRVPEHEPWPRVLKQDKGDTVNEENKGYLDNVDKIDQYDNEGEAGRKYIGVIEGDEKIERGPFWRR